MLEHLLTIADEMFGKQHRKFDVVFAEQVQQELLAFDLRQPPKSSVAPEKIERVVDEPTLPARCQLCLQFGKVGAALVDYDHLSIDNGLAGNVESASDG